MRPASLVGLGIVFFSCTMSAQRRDIPFTVDSAAFFSIQSASDTFDVFDGSHFLGTTPLQGTMVIPGTHVLRYAVHCPDVWRETSEAETLTATAGKRIERTISPPAIRSITSEPYGAGIFAGDSLLGKTPALVILDHTVHTLRFVKPGFEEQTVALSSGAADIHVVLSIRPDSKTPGSEVILAGYNSRGDFPIYASGAVAVLSGAAAAYWKIKSDNYYDNYRNTGNTDALTHVHSLDKAAGASLIISEIGISVFTWLLLTR